MTYYQPYCVEETYKEAIKTAKIIEHKARVRKLSEKEIKELKEWLPSLFMVVDEEGYFIGEIKAKYVVEILVGE